MKLILTSENQSMIDALKVSFQNVPDVEINKECPLKIPADCVLNLLNNGFFFVNNTKIEEKLHVQHKLQSLLLVEDFDELLVGEAIIIGTDDPVYKYVVSTPVMRVPMPLTGTVNVFLAFRAALKEVLAHNAFVDEGISSFPEKPITSLICPCIETENPTTIASQMREAYDQIMMSKTRSFKKIEDACEFHQSLAKGIIPPFKENEN